MRRLISKTQYKDQLMLLLITPRVSVSRKFRAFSPREREGISPVFLRDAPGQRQFVCIDLSGYAHHFSFPQNNRAHSLCVILSPLICAMQLIIHFMFSQCILCSFVTYIIWFSTDMFFHVSLNQKIAVLKIPQIHGQKPNKINVNPR